MFSGIISHQAPILSIQDGLFTVKNMFSEPLKIGQSIAHDGACMTIAEITDDTYSFFAMKETLRVTNFHEKHAGDTFNVELALRMGDFLDGHLVSGHIDTVGVVAALTPKADGSLLFTVQCDTLEPRFVIPKGSITLNGVSLTLVDIIDNTLTVSLIPLTQQWTNLGAAKIGESINVEYDMIAKFVSKMVLPIHAS